MFDAALRGGNREVEDGDEFGETMILMVLCLVVSLLLYIRGRWVERLRREEQQQQRQQQQLEQREERNNGLFPPAGEPARGDDWAVAR
jgi:SEL1 protein